MDYSRRTENSRPDSAGHSGGDGTKQLRPKSQVRDDDTQVLMWHRCLNHDVDADDGDTSSKTVENLGPCEFDGAE